MGMADSSVVSLAERLKQRREELGISQAQAARELDVARTAYRLWEMEAARPAPDRWRLIARWLGVSVTTMLLAENLMSESEAAMSDVVEVNFGRTGREWDAGARQPGYFFAQARALVSESADSGALDAEEAETLLLVISRIEQEKAAAASVWEEAELRKVLPADVHAPHAARRAMAVVAEAVPDERLATAQLLVSELVTDSVRQAAPGSLAKVGIFIRVERDLLRAEVSSRSPRGARSPGLDQDGYAFMFFESLASQWGSNRNGAHDVTWFELHLPPPGAPS
jgi:transcriptional regulator with XRE-family HTH domain